MEGKLFQTSAQSYGKGSNMELFKDNSHNIHENKDLRALERRLPKNWKKAKWTPRKFELNQRSTLMTPYRSWARRSELIVVRLTLPFYDKNP